MIKVLRMVMMPSNDFPGGKLIYCHREKREEKKDVWRRSWEGGSTASAFSAVAPKP